MPKGKRKGRLGEKSTRNERPISTVPTYKPTESENTERGNTENNHSLCASVEACDISDTLKNDGINIDLTDRMPITIGLPAKQAPGRLGRKINLISNLFPIALLPDGNIYHYDVKIINHTSESNKPEDKNYNRYRCLNTRVNREIIDKVINTNAQFRNSSAVYDGESNLYTSSPLKLKNGEIIIENQNKEVFVVVIKPVEKKNAYGMKVEDCTINLNVLHELFRGKMGDVDDIQEAVMALETIFRHSPALRYVPIGRNFFHPKIGGVNPLSGGIEIWFGYHQSLRLGQWGPMVNLNTSATTFFCKQSLIEYLAKFLKVRVDMLSNLTQIDEKTIKKLTGDLKNVKIETYHQTSTPKMVHRIVKVTKQRADKLEFVIDSKTFNVASYFLEIYNKKLKYPHLPCVQVKAKNKIYFPLEVCFIPEGQHSRKELSVDNKRNMIKYTADPPGTKFDKIIKIRLEQANYDEDKHLKSFGIKVGNEPIGIPARFLQAPNLEYNNQKIQPIDGKWDLRGLQFYEGSKIHSWFLLSLASEDICNYGNLKCFSGKLLQIGRAAGLKMASPVEMKIIANPEDENDKILNKVQRELSIIQRKKIQLTVIVIPDKSPFLYRNVKQIAEVHLGLLTQCIDHENVINCKLSLLSNLCLKINAKMGGINHTLTQGEIPQIMEKPVILIGADVSHAPATDKSGISVAAVAGGLDMKLSRFAVTCRLQKNPKANKKSLEIILELKDLVKSLLKAFYNHTMGKKPEKIIFYRDGVSDGHFHEVKEKEVMAIRRACIELQNDYQPAITFVVVQKRHQQRFRPEDFRQGVRPERNVPPGTVVDTDIVHPIHRDFYLCSHLGLKGTSRPAHYTVLEDDSDFSADDLQKLTYYTCNISFRCSKSISIPVPVAYADLAAYRTRLRLSLLPEDQRESQENSAEILQETLDATTLVDSIKNSMYFV